MSDPRRLVPRTDAVLADPRLTAAIEQFGRARVKHAVASGLQLVRDGRLAPDDVADQVVASLGDPATSLRRVINATGVVLHTNLGRAALSDAAREALQSASGYVDVEYDLESGQRAKRGRGALAALTRAVPAAGDALVVNNGAAALVLATTALARDREVIVSRGELVEIGDGFRLPDLIASTGARLREVGTTNRVTRDDYAAAIGPDTGCILKVHPSNFRIEGFTSAVPVRELAQLGVPVVVDIGSGLLARAPAAAGRAGRRHGTHRRRRRRDRERRQAARRPAGRHRARTRRDRPAPAAPSAGTCVAGRQAHPRRARGDAHRADDADLDGHRGRPRHVAATLCRVGRSGRRQGGRRAAASSVAAVRPVSNSTAGPSRSPSQFARPLRAGRPPVITRVEHERCLLDLRCVDPTDDTVVRDAVLRAVDA